MDKAKAVLKDVTYVDDMNDVAEGCDALVIATEWPIFKKLDLERVRKAMTHPIMFDGRNLFDRRKWKSSASFTRASGDEIPRLTSDPQRPGHAAADRRP
jgi:UDPglucose 6-dehydrogenase